MSDAYPTWPFSCPRSWSRQPVPSLVRTTVDDGYPKVRRRFTKTWSEIQVQWLLNWEDEAGLLQFFEQDCLAGAQPFYVENPYTEALVLVRWKEPPTIAGSADTKPVIQASGTLEEVFS